MKQFTNKQKEFIEKHAPNLAEELFGEKKEDDDYLFEVDIRNAIKNASANGQRYIGINKIARAIKSGIGDDLTILIKELNKIK